MASKSTSSTPRTRRRTTAKETDEQAEQVEPVVDDPVAKDAPMPANDEDFGAGLSDAEAGERFESNGEFGDDGDRPANGGGDGGDGGEPDPNRRRRRRRRRRRGDGEGPGPNTRTQQRRGGRRGGRTGHAHQQRDHHVRRQSAPSANGEEVTGTIEGALELHPKGYGFLRDPSKNYMSQETDPFVSSSLIEKHLLREGVIIRGEVGPGSRGQGPRLKSIETVDGRSLEDFAKIKHFDDLTPINPFEQIKLERGKHPITMRVMDLLTPIGKGQRALLVAPPRTGKTMLLHDIAESVSTNHPEIHLMVLLIDERPEEVTEIKRNVRGEVIASSMDREVESHIRISQLIVERAKRLAEAGGHVVMLLDSITRTARAFNKWVGNSGRTGTGGLDVKALDIPRKMFGTARRFDEGGSLTVIATALIETGSRMDDAIFQEFKGTGNMELVLSRQLADRRIWPAMDITQSGTRREEKIIDPELLDGIIMLRRSLVSLSPVEAMEQLISTLEKFPTNKEFLARIRQVL
jgi:transcription termination factor Rho